MSLAALITGTSGLSVSSFDLNVVGNDLANLNTTGFKAQNASFQDTIYQTLTAGSGPNGTVGGTNPSQQGSGVQVGAIDNAFSQGTVTPTGQPLDAAITGNGFFVVSNGTSESFTRAGSFSVDANGFLVDPNTGDLVQRTGTVGNATATTPGFQTAGNNNIQIPFGAGLPGVPTANVTYQGNLDSGDAVGGSTTTSIQVFDSQSSPITLNVTFTKTGTNTWQASGTSSDGTVTIPNTPVTFDPTTGLLASPASLQATISGLTDGAPDQTVNLNLGSVGQGNGLTQFGGDANANAVTQDGTGFGTLTSVTIDQSGTIQGSFSNGETAPIAQLAVADFNNVGGLERTGNNYFTATASSGQALVGTAAAGGNVITGSALEGSNVDIATEFSQLIVAERGFQVNAETITAADNTLQTLTNIIH